MKIKHTLTSQKDKKATIIHSELKELIPKIDNLSRITLFYKNINIQISYHKSRNGSTWYADDKFPDNKYLPKIGKPIMHEVEYVTTKQIQQTDSLPLFESNEIKLTDEFEPIRNWASKRGIYYHGDVKTQVIKLIEETGELSKSILKADQDEFIDAIGDCIVVLTNLAELGNDYFTNLKEKISIELCIKKAYHVIKNREGKMENGTFVKKINNEI
jgi:NTP pyrophosphatase (non-canonical NTP hydrolase)